MRCTYASSCIGGDKQGTRPCDSEVLYFVQPLPINNVSVALSDTEWTMCAGLWQGNHDGLAAFLAATGPAALPDAAALLGLSLRAELRLCRGAGQLRRALACLTAMAAGATERSALAGLPCWRGSDSFMRPSTAGAADTL